ncbi:MAG: PhnD/SsuA/transferrin family substrate-binding protein [Nitrospirota bacterium]
MHIGIVPFYTPESIWRSYSPLVRYLNETTALQWKLKLFNSHNAIINGICSGEIDIAFLGPVPFGRASTQCGARPLLVAIGKNGKPYYHSVIVTARTSIETIGDVRGKRFALYKHSTASYVLPLKMLEDEGIALEEITPVYYTSQDRIVDALIRHEADAAGVKESLYEKFKKLNLRKLKISEPLPNFVFCTAPNTGPEIAEAFSTALLRLKPRSRKADKKITGEWDEEIRYGFMKPPATFLRDIARIQELDNRYRQ